MNKTLALAALGSATVGTLLAQSNDNEVVLPPINVYSPSVANQESVSSFAMPVTSLRFDPLVDVQARNQAEGQADVSIRGGLFENTGFKLGALSLWDPQTGHYFAELPVAPIMLTAPVVLTAADNASGGFNATVGTVGFGWREIKTQGMAVVSAGQHESNRQEFYQGYSRSFGSSTKVGVDFSAARSESAGVIQYGDHYFERYNGRIQVSSSLGQTDLFAGYQEKFFGWPNLYTPFNVNETEDLQTLLISLNHLKKFSNGDFLQAGAYWRRNTDDYEYNRFIPGQYNPYQHTTWVRGFSAEGRSSFGSSNFALNSAASAMFDDIKSTSLKYGRFMSRQYYKASLVPEVYTQAADGSRLTLKAGAAFDDTNRDDSAFSPIVEISRIANVTEGLSKLYASFSKSSQVATYTALNSNPNGGLFRGNPNLGRMTSNNAEIGAHVLYAGWKFRTSVFCRNDSDLVDWTFPLNAQNARTANEVDITTLGFEATATRSWKSVDLVLGYTALGKDSDYKGATYAASFYALNFPRHRLTAAVVARLGAGFELRLDNEARSQEDNPQRASDSTEYFLSSLGLAWRPHFHSALTVSAQVDNLWGSNFQEVPAVPACPRQASVSVAYHW